MFSQVCVCHSGREGRVTKHAIERGHIPVWILAMQLLKGCVTRGLWGGVHPPEQRHTPDPPNQRWPQADGTLPTGMHSCLAVFSQTVWNWKNLDPGGVHGAPLDRPMLLVLIVSNIKVHVMGCLPIGIMKLKMEYCGNCYGAIMVSLCDCVVD